MASGDPELQDIRVSSGNLFPFLHPWNGYRRWTTQKGLCDNQAQLSTSAWQLALGTQSPTYLLTKSDI